MTSNDRTYHGTDAEYKLPNDAPEHERLDEQHAGISAVMGGQIIRSPLGKPRSIVDVGCGTGIVTCHLGCTFPEAQVYGVDLSPVPPVHVKPDNVSFVQGDIKDALGLDEPLGKETIGFVFSRLLIGGMVDWQTYVNSVVALARPGAYVEMQEAEFTYLIDDKDVSAEWPWMQAFHAAMKKRRMDPVAGQNLAMYFQNAGLEDVQAITYEWPWGSWKADRGYPELRRFGTHLGETMPATWQGLLRKMLEGQGYDADEMETFLANCHDDVQPEDGKYMPWHVVYGRKPL